MEVIVKPTYKVLKGKDFITILAKIYFDISADTELKVLKSLYTQSTNLSITITKQMNKHISQQNNIKPSAISTAIHRLTKSKAISKDGRVIYLHPIFNGVDQSLGLLFKA